MPSKTICMMDSINWTSKGKGNILGDHLGNKMNADKDGYTVRLEF